MPKSAAYRRLEQWREGDAVAPYATTRAFENDVLALLHENHVLRQIQDETATALARMVLRLRGDSIHLVEEQEK